MHVQMHLHITGMIFTWQRCVQSDDHDSVIATGRVHVNAMIR
jgi:hypothetical protein